MDFMVIVVIVAVILAGYLIYRAASKKNPTYTPGPPNTGGDIVGTMTLPEKYNNDSGVAVRLYGPDGTTQLGQTITDVLGAYAFESMPPGVYSIKGTKDKYVWSSPTFTVTSGTCNIGNGNLE